ncbi:unnamed protein product [Ilex paraguariensis]|uniref:Ferredoxin thioredoxin reductase alpha chain domain-containing protein n=1 Tax=Ilex paraguariensis TaxID=185542 RepID=A0ABC8V3H8_9AQUA
MDPSPWQVDKPIKHTLANTTTQPNRNANTYTLLNHNNQRKKKSNTMTTPIFFSKPPLISHQSSQFLTISTPNLPSFLISRPSINFQRKNATSDSTTIIDTPSVSLYSEDDDKAAVEAKIGSRVRVKVPLKVYHVPKVPEFELTGMIGVLKQYVGVWKGKRISANFPYKIEFVTEIEGRKGPVKFFAHLREDEFEL